MILFHSENIFSNVSIYNLCFYEGEIAQMIRRLLRILAIPGSKPVDSCRVRTILQLESKLQLVVCAEKIFKQECYLMFIEAQVIHN